MLIFIEKECDIEELVNELDKRIKNAEKDEEYNLEFPITKAMEILDVLRDMSTKGLLSTGCTLSAEGIQKVSNPKGIKEALL